MVRIAVGMMGSSVASGSGSLATAAQVKEFLSVVKKHAVKELDTARVYNGGKSEELLGEVKACDDFVISTKAPGFSPGSLSEANILRNAKLSVEALGKIDIYYFHGPDSQTPLEEQCRAIGHLYKQGTFKRFGISNLNDKQVEQIWEICKREGYPPPSVYQGNYSAMSRNNLRALRPILDKYGMQFYAYSPLAGGLLAKGIDATINPEKGSRYESMPVFGKMFHKPEMVEAFRHLQAACDAAKTGLMEATLRWTLHHSDLQERDAVIIGAGKTEQIDASLTACEKGPLESKELINAFDELWTAISDVAPPAFL